MAAHYTLVLGTKNWSSWSLRPYLAMRATGAAFDEIVVAAAPRRHHEPKSCKHSPSGKVPVLKIEEDGETTTVFDSLAICETLAERHPQAGLWPDDWRTRAHWRAPMPRRCIPDSRHCDRRCRWRSPASCQRPSSATMSKPISRAFWKPGRAR